MAIVRAGFHKTAADFIEQPANLRIGAPAHSPLPFCVINCVNLLKGNPLVQDISLTLDTLRKNQARQAITETFAFYFICLQILLV